MGDRFYWDFAADGLHQLIGTLGSRLGPCDLEKNM